MQIITLFNHKGGVAKTTNAYNLGWKLANSGHRVVLVDADSQCNLTGMAMGLLGEGDTGSDSASDSDSVHEGAEESPNEDYQELQQKNRSFWQSVAENNIHSALKPVFMAEPRALEPVDCIPVKGNDGLFLLPGSLDFANYESDLALAQALQGSLGSHRNLPGAIRALLELTAEHMAADYLIVDLSPSLGAINQNIVSISDQIIIPCAPDFFSVMALESLASVLPAWKEWATELSGRKAIQDATYSFPKPSFKFSGIVISRFVIYKQRPARAFATWIKNVEDECANVLFPALEAGGITFSEAEYTAAGLDQSHTLALVREFQSLRPKSQLFGVPVFDLTADQIGLKGNALRNSLDQVDEARTSYELFAQKIERLS